MQKAEEEQQQSSTAVARDVVIMYYNEKYHLYNVHSINSHVAVESLLNFLNQYEVL